MASEAAAQQQQQQQQQQQWAGAGASKGGRPSWVRRIAGSLVVAVLGGGLAAGGGLTVATVAVIAGLATPILLFLSPILVPLAIAVAAVTAGLLGSAAALLAVAVAVSWLQSYRKGRKIAAAAAAAAGGERAHSLQRYLAETAGTVKDAAQSMVAGTAPASDPKGKTPAAPEASS